MGFLDALAAPSMLLLPFYLPDAELGTVFLEFDYIDSASVDPLNSQAWAFQEALLSPRILYYELQGSLLEMPRGKNQYQQVRQ